MRIRRATGTPTPGAWGVAEPTPIRSGLVQAALRGECPQCSAPTLFDGWVSFASRCRGCGLDFTQYNVGDGPAGFLTLIIGALVTGLAISFHLAVDPPFWVNAVIWIPVTTVLVIGSLRVSKAMMLIHEHRAEVREGRLADTNDREPGP